MIRLYIHVRNLIFFFFCRKTALFYLNNLNPDNLNPDKLIRSIYPDNPVNSSLKNFHPIWIKRIKKI